VRVSARLTEEGEAVVFSVADTGIGIPPEHHQCIFQEFAQLDNEIQRRVRGTGLGLPLSRKLAELLGGRLTLESQPGVGSVFSAVIPLVYRDATSHAELQEAEPVAATSAGQVPILIVENSPEDLLLYEKYLRRSEFQIFQARSLRDARRLLQQMHPAAIVLDILFAGEQAWQFLSQLKQEEGTRDIPVVVATTVDDQRKALALGADAYAMKPINRDRMLETLRRLVQSREAEDILVIDDEEASRYVLRHYLAATKRAIREAVNGAEGLAMIQARKPALIVLDLVMPGLSGTEVLDRLKANPETRRIPIIIATSKRLSADEQETLEARALTVLSKEMLSQHDAGDRLREVLDKAGFRRL
jgi:CheY-like chemotaxis protein